MSALMGICWLVLMPVREDGRSFIGVLRLPEAITGLIEDPGAIGSGFNFPLVLAKPAPSLSSGPIFYVD